MKVSKPTTQHKKDVNRKKSYTFCLEKIFSAMVSGWQDKKRDKPAPGQETRLGIMPGCHKRENDPNIAHGRSHAAQRHVHITNQSQVETPVLTPPES